MSHSSGIERSARALPAVNTAPLDHPHVISSTSPDDDALHTPTETPAILTTHGNAPSKSEPIGFTAASEDHDVLHSPSVTAGALGGSTRPVYRQPVGKVAPSVFGNVAPIHRGTYSSKHPTSVSGNRSDISTEELSGLSASRRPSVDLETYFGQKIQTSRTYVPPHLRSENSRRRNSTIEPSGLPEAEDSFYTLPSTSHTRQTPPRIKVVAHRHQLEPPYSPPATLIARQPYDDPTHHKHPAPIQELEEEEASFRSADSESGEADDEDDYEDVFSSAPLSPRSFTGSDISSRVTIVAAQARVRPLAVDTNVCTSCGAPPVSSFIALIPCDHLLCHQCLNTLINSAAHKPPRPMDCFACGVLVKSFGPAFAGAGGLVDALRTTLGEIGVAGAPVRDSGLVGGRGGQSVSTSRGKENVSEPSVSISSVLSPPLPKGAIKTNTTTPKAKSLLARLQHSIDKGMDSGVGTPETVAGLSPIRKLDWAEEPLGTPRRTEDIKATSAVQPLADDTLLVPMPMDWPVLRLDNIPWDITVAEIEDWLPDDTLAPVEECVLAVHILCNRSDGRTLNQCYIEAVDLAAARHIVRSRNGKKLRNRPVHLTLSTQGDLMSTIFPSWMPGFNGLDVPLGRPVAPLVMQTELTGLLTLCKLESNHASKVQERPFFNIVTLLQKFPWHQPHTYNSKQIVRMYNTSLAAVEIVLSLRDRIPDWYNVLTILVDAATACPVFRPAQKVKFLQVAGLQDINDSEDALPPRATFSPAALRETFVTVGDQSKHYSPDVNTSPTPFRTLDTHHRPSSSHPSSDFSSLSSMTGRVPAPVLRSVTNPDSAVTSAVKGKGRARRLSSISRQLGLDDSVIRAVAEQLGLEIAD